ncbi:tungsten ABC transporter substrate-binding protein [Methanothermobacter thermautotrophicus]|uniref:Tungsten ABC transporter substrate-binding protein n=1 Tax=Methanothermobacter thermautotrophicus TaxID=145262 RepID=A0A842YMX4_METTF|nr:substrate-binding domain-containing protein [Methanothermobacter thermautotrophicus]MBE2900736.1 tungsten ABC transporter substrate-binding protein [Methanothermobacter thermautotrophicus]
MDRKYVALAAVAAVILLGIGFYAISGNGDREILRISTTTSLEDTGLLEDVEAAFERKYPGIDVQIVSGGTGIALERGKRGDADLVIVHDKEREEKFINEGYGVKRYPFAYNYFYIVGPADDPAGIKNAKTGEDAFSKILEGAEKNPRRVKFVSRGDNSGTNSREISIWKKVTDYNATVNGSAWYIETGSGMGDTLRVADEKDAYTLTDSGTYLSYRNRTDLVAYLTEDRSLLNVYSAIPLNPSKVKGVNTDAAEKFINFLMSEECQRLIADYGKDKYGQPLFMVITGGYEPG